MLYRIKRRYTRGLIGTKSEPTTLNETVGVEYHSPCGSVDWICEAVEIITVKNAQTERELARAIEDGFDEMGYRLPYPQRSYDEVLADYEHLCAILRDGIERFEQIVNGSE